VEKEANARVGKLGDAYNLGGLGRVASYLGQFMLTWDGTGWTLLSMQALYALLIHLLIDIILNVDSLS
jgi:hypothetical protein